MHRRYNPEGMSRLNIVPGLLGVILTMTMVMMTALAVTRERERGTMENLLAMPVRPIEVMIGKILPYIAVGAVQVVVILLVAWLLFGVGVQGSLAAVLPRHGAVHRRQPGHRLHHLDAGAEPAAGDAGLVLLLPAVDPAVGLHVPLPRHAGAGRSGSARSCRLTHFLRIVRGVMLKGAGFGSISAELAALLAILLIVSTLAISRYRVTLD